MDETSFDKIKRTIVSKSSLKQDVFALTKDVFQELRTVLSEVTNELREFIVPADPRIAVELSATGSFEAQMTLAGDTVIFHMHTNVFAFPETHVIHRNPYVIKDPSMAYCGIINIYNFLTDSFRYQRLNDSGYLVGRIFVNKEKHFFVEGKKQLGFLFNDFSNAVLDQKAMRSIIESALLYVLDFDLYTPPYQAVKEVTLDDMQQLSQNLKLKTAKRLGFQFYSSEGGVEF